MEERWQLAKHLSGLSTFEVGRYVSYLVNVIVFLNWLRNRVVLRRFLVGQWDGTFTKEGVDGIIFYCQLYVAGHRDKEDTAVFSYERRDLRTSFVGSRGADILESYDNDMWFVWRRTWNPRFVRHAHDSLTNVADEDAVLRGSELPKRYTWECRVKDLFFRPKMAVRIESIEGRYVGQLAKH